MGIGVAELVIIFAILVLIVLSYAPPFWIAYDAHRLGQERWERAGQNQLLWMLGPFACALCCGPLILVALAIYLLQVRPAVLAA